MLRTKALGDMSHRNPVDWTPGAALIQPAHKTLIMVTDQVCGSWYLRIGRLGSKPVRSLGSFAASVRPFLSNDMICTSLIRGPAQPEPC